jgi:hypothetical protein
VFIKSCSTSELLLRLDCAFTKRIPSNLKSIFRNTSAAKFSLLSVAPHRLTYIAASLFSDIAITMRGSFAFFQFLVISVSTWPYSWADKTVYLDRPSDSQSWEPHFSPKSVSANVGENIHFVLRLQELDASVRYPVPHFDF